METGLVTPRTPLHSPSTVTPELGATRELETLDRDTTHDDPSAAGRRGAAPPPGGRGS